MKKPAKTQKEKTAARRVPDGLVTAFTLVRHDDANTRWAPATARDAYPFALRVIDGLHDRSDEGRSDVLREAAQVAHGPADIWTAEEIENNGELRADAAFDVGFAVCWLLMTQVNGGAR